ncbi:hypothetical protein UY3_10009 [Chelonia mydas]|uniref:Uncharacterized protein n=1 Tax=Chelonia mydas TaxID=8469 RepID=M7BXQ2_CHEMY|nr:hypothetical protein UY3_10009 [Chelonia mydas]
MAENSPVDPVNLLFLGSWSKSTRERLLSMQHSEDIGVFVLGKGLATVLKALPHWYIRGAQCAVGPGAVNGVIEG